ncbi:MAG: PKD domain-containing protein [Flavobacteriaceae bacterium]
MRLAQFAYFWILLSLYTYILQAQTPQITVVPPDVANLLSVCEGDLLEFTATGGGIFSDPKSYAFYAIRTGHSDPVLLRPRMDDNTLFIFAGLDPDELQDGDFVFARVWDQTTADGGGNFSDSGRQIEIEMFARPRPTLYDNLVGHVFCPDEPVQFGVLPDDAPRYLFYRNNILIQDSSQASLDIVLNHLDVIRVDVYNSHGCVGTSSLQLSENQVEEGGHIGFQGEPDPFAPVFICYNTSPPPILSESAAVYAGTPLADNDLRYHWYSSIDGWNWEDLNHHQASYSPSALVTSTFFKRDLLHSLAGASCSVESNILQVVVAPQNLGGTPRTSMQTLCAGDVPFPLIIDGGTSGPGVSYQWEISMDGVNFTELSSYANSERYDPPALFNSTFYRRKTSVHSDNCISYSDPIHIQVITVDPGVLDPHQSRQLCYGAMDHFLLDDAPLVPGNLGEAPTTDSYTALSYQWEFSSDQGISWNRVPEGDTKSLELSGPWTETTFYRRRVLGESNHKVCADQISENIIEIQVWPSMGTPNIDGPLELCENAVTGTLTLTAIDLALPITFQWQSSTDGVEYSNISGADSYTLDLGMLNIRQTTYFRIRLTNTQTGCVSESRAHRLEWQALHTLHQTQGPVGAQQLCPGDELDPIVFTYGGGATDLSIRGDLVGSGLVVTHDEANQTVHISGTPNSSVEIQWETQGNSCSPQRGHYSVEVSPNPVPPDAIFADDVLLEFQTDGTQITHYRVCEDDLTTQFSSEIFHVNLRSHIEFVWELLTVNAGSLDRDTGLMQWRKTPLPFTGMAQFRVAGINACGQTSAWMYFQIEVVADQIPPIPPGAVSQIFHSGNEPSCTITPDHEDTNYYVGIAPDDTSQTIVGGVHWSLAVIHAGNPSTPLPGTIDILSGVVQWNDGFWGTFNIIADPVNCEDESDPDLRQLRTVTIPEPPPTTFDIFVDRNDPDNSLPECSGTSAGRTTLFNSNLAPQFDRRWSINNVEAGWIDALSGRLHWTPDFDGHLEIRLTIHQPEECEERFSILDVFIPPIAVVTLTSEINTVHQELCAQEDLNEIRYEAIGHHETIQVLGLPDGISPNHITQNQISRIDFTGNVAQADSRIVLQIDNQLYRYQTQVANESALQIATAFHDFLQHDRTVDVEQVGSSLVLESQFIARSFMLQFSSPASTLSIQQHLLQDASSTAVISGRPTDVPGIYRYEVRARGVEDGCASSSIMGSIQILSDSRIELESGMLDQQLCNRTTLVTITFNIEHAQGVTVDPPTAENNYLDGLPSGIQLYFQNGQAVITGIPEVSINYPTTYNFVLRTLNNDRGCAETFIEGSITVLPEQTIEPLGNARQQVIQLCAGDSIRDVDFQLSSPIDSQNFSADLSQLPPGVSGVFSATSLIYSLQGNPTPTPELEVFSDYPFSLTVSSCSGVQTVTRILRVYPRPSLSLISTVSTTHQQICNSVAIEPIAYDLRGTQQFSFQIIPEAPWLSTTYDPASGEIILEGSPQLILEGPLTYSYNISAVGTLFNCSTSLSVTGTIRVLPEAELRLESDISSLDQSVCVGSSIIPIEYVMGGGIGGIAVRGLPDGVVGNVVPQIAQTEIPLGGLSTVLAGEVYGIQLDELLFEYHSQVGETAAQIARALVDLIDPHPNYSASVQGASIVITAVAPGIPLQVLPFTRQHASLNFSAPVPIQWARSYEITGSPLPITGTDQSFHYTIEARSSACGIVLYEGDIRVISNSEITQISSPKTFNQVLCDGDLILPITLRFGGGAQVVSVAGEPPGISYSIDLSQNTITFSGYTQLDNVDVQTYVITVTTVGNIGHCTETHFSFPIQILPLDQLQLISAPESAHQMLCSDDPSSQLTPIRYQYWGTSDEYIITGLPDGILHSFDPDTRIIEINGGVFGVNEPTPFTYVIQSVNSDCSTHTIAGTIQVNTHHTLELLTLPSTANQTGIDVVCRGEAIVPIQYRFGNGARDVFVTGLPPGVIPTRVGTHTLEISGTPTIAPNTNEFYDYTVTTQGDGNCHPATMHGRIEIFPEVTIDRSFIELQDVRHLSCAGAHDGAIEIPEDPDALGLRIQGGISDIAQVDRVEFQGATVALEVVYLELNDIRFSHTIIPQWAGGPPQTWAQVLQILVDQINTYEATHLGVRASFQAPSTLIFTATTAGQAFTINSHGVEQVTSLVQSQHSTITDNRTGNYQFRWSGPNGYYNSSLSITDLAAGIYTLSVFVENCEQVQAEASFELLEPDLLTVSERLCDRVIELSASGATGPYIFELYDDADTLIDSVVDPQGILFEDLLAGATYRYVVRDQNCSTAIEETIVLPLALTFDMDAVDIQHDECEQYPPQGDGYIHLGVNGSPALSGGSGIFEYQWNGPNGYTASGASIDNLAPGLYLLTARDIELGCVYQTRLEILGTTPLVILPSPASGLTSNNLKVLECSNSSEAVVEINVDGGSGAYLYQWSFNGNPVLTSTGPSISNLVPGTYSCLVTDRNARQSCTEEFSFDVVAPSPLSFYYTLIGSSTEICQQEDVYINVEILGGTAPYTLYWGDEVLRSGITESVLQIQLPAAARSEGEVNLRLADANDCSPEYTSDPIPLASFNPVEIRYDSTIIDCSRGIEGQITLRVIAGSLSDPQRTQIEVSGPDFHQFYNWQQSGGVISNLEQPGNYHVTVTSPDGCELFAETIPLISATNGGLQVSIEEISPPGCNGNLGRIQLAVQDGRPPYSIIWEIFDENSTPSWRTLPELQNRSLATGLAAGIYRVSVSDQSNPSTSADCVSSFTSENIYLYDRRSEILNFTADLNVDNCDYSEQDFTLSFRFESSNPSAINIQLNPPAGSLVRFDSNGRYRFENVPPGDYTLSIEEPTSTCPILHSFSLTAVEPLSYSGAIYFEEDICLSTSRLYVDTTLVEGGIPFEFDEMTVYEYRWDYLPASGGSQIRNFVGAEIQNPEAGEYNLYIYDANGCHLYNSLTYLLTDSPQEEFSVGGNLMLTTGEVVKVLAPSCDMPERGGQIGIAISGGLAPYSIIWEHLDSDSADPDMHWTPLVNFQNQTYLSGLDPGLYRLTIQSANPICEQTNPESAYVFWQEIIEVPESEDIILVDGPYISESLCDLNPGTLSISLYNPLDETLEFFYNGTLTNVLQTSPNELLTNFIIEIAAPEREGLVQIFNLEGCLMDEFELDIHPLGTPHFTYDSPNLQLHQEILPREAVEFTSTSSGEYQEEEWSFGDSSPIIRRERTSSVSSPVIHTYLTQGTYHVRLRIFNELGCYAEYIESISIGLGYHLLFPTVFTPNGDGVNDYFRPVLNGFDKINFFVYNSHGQLLYTEIAERSSAHDEHLLEGWDGATADASEYFIFSFTGILPDGSTVERSGTFMLLR